MTKGNRTNYGLQNISQKTKDPATHTPLNTWSELRCSRRVSCSCSICDTCRVTRVANPVTSHEWGKVRIVITTNGRKVWRYQRGTKEVVNRIRTDNTIAKRIQEKMTNKDLQSIKQKTKNWATHGDCWRIYPIDMWVNISVVICDRYIPYQLTKLYGGDRKLSKWWLHLNHYKTLVQ